MAYTYALYVWIESMNVDTSSVLSRRFDSQSIDRECNFLYGIMAAAYFPSSKGYNQLPDDNGDAVERYTKC